jgi:hypothetical protein
MDVGAFGLKRHTGCGVSAGIPEFAFEPVPMFLLYDLQDTETANFRLKNTKDQTGKIIGCQDGPWCLGFSSEDGLGYGCPLAAVGVESRKRES